MLRTRFGTGSNIMLLLHILDVHLQEPLCQTNARASPMDFGGDMPCLKEARVVLAGGCKLGVRSDILRWPSSLIGLTRHSKLPLKASRQDSAVISCRACGDLGCFLDGRPSAGTPKGHPCFGCALRREPPVMRVMSKENQLNYRGPLFQEAPCSAKGAAILKPRVASQWFSAASSSPLGAKKHEKQAGRSRKRLQSVRTPFWRALFEGAIQGTRVPDWDPCF